MKFIDTRIFKRRYPGPFGAFHGSDGVDATFDVACLTTDKRIVSTYYWDDEKGARFTADIVAAALNYTNGDSHWPLKQYLTQVLGTDLADFFEDHPGPFKTNRDRCPMHGELYNIRCQSSGTSVIQRVDFDSLRNAKQTAVHIAQSLNHLRDYHLATGRDSNA